MKKTNLVIIALAAIALIAGCKKEDSTIEGRIAKAMKEYARENFNDPKSLKEIVSVSLDDTTNIVMFAQNILAESHRLDSIYTVIDDSAKVLLKKTLNMPKSSFYKLPDWEKEKLQTTILEIEVELYSNLINTGMRRQLYNEIDSLLKTDTLYTISLYDIKTRVDEGELKLKTFHTWICDTTKIINIYPDPVPASTFSRETEITEKCGKLIELDNNRLKYAMKQFDCYREALFRLE